MKIYRTVAGLVAERDSRLKLIPDVTIDDLLKHERPLGWLDELLYRGAQDVDALPQVLAPIESQEVWAAGVTYFRSRTARMEESKDAGGGNFYDRVYSADRPELFFKATPHRVVGPGQPIRIRSDSKWNVPEPELTLVVTSHGKIVGYTIGNDVSSRDIEGANPLYLPQAKCYMGSCALGPAIWLSEFAPPPTTQIRLQIRRGDVIFDGSTTLSQLRRRPEELVEYLYRENAFPVGCFLMTGTGIIPPDDFSLRSGDYVGISIEGIGDLGNPVA